MSASWKRRPARAWIVVGVAALLATAGCGALGPDYDKIQISDHYPVGNSPSPECVKAAKDATYWCESGVTHSLPEIQSNCSKARWEHARAC